MVEIQEAPSGQSANAREPGKRREIIMIEIIFFHFGTAIQAETKPARIAME